VKARFLWVAQEDLKEAARYYEAQRAGLGVEFREKVRATVERIKSLPGAWQPLSENTRRCQSDDFRTA
jgi:plasmid stabilization system protein ParE